MNQSGNVLFLILIAVALFAALSYAVTQSNRGGGSDASMETQLITSSSVMQYAATLESAMTRIRVLNGCEEDQYSFERAPFDGSDSDYINTKSPADFSCHVFHPNGGGVAEAAVPNGVNDGSDWFYTYARVFRVGPDQTFCQVDACGDVLLMLGGMNRGACEKINDRWRGSTAIPVQDNGVNYRGVLYDGDFQTLGGRDIDGGAQAQPTLCTESADNILYFYHVLLPR